MQGSVGKEPAVLCLFLTERLIEWMGAWWACDEKRESSGLVTNSMLCYDVVIEVTLQGRHKDAKNVTDVQATIAFYIFLPAKMVCTVIVMFMVRKT